MPTETRKLVKARPKAPEYLPEWAKCCAELIRLSQSFDELIVDISSVHIYPVKFCRFCGAPLPKLVGVNVPERGNCALDWLDLDEGAYTDAH